MKNKGVVRYIDKLGRLVIPKEMRDILGLNSDEPVQIIIKDNQIIIEKYTDVCLICGKSSEKMLIINNKNICFDCAHKIIEDVN